MKRILIAVMAAGAVSAPVAAQNMRGLDAELTRTGHKVAQCLYQKRKADVVASLGAPTPADFQRYYTSFRRTPQCADITVNTRAVVGAGVESSPDVMRGMLAEAALSNMAKARGLAPETGEASYVRDWFGATGRDRTVDEMAVCVAAQDPSGVRALLATLPEGSEEMAAVQQLSPSLGPCLPAGAKLKANRQSLRAALAEALYHRATAPAMAATK